MKPGDRRANAGFTLLELTVAIAVIGTLAGFLLDRAARYQEMAEKAAMESTVRLIKTGLQIRLAELIVANRQAQASQLETEDPVRWLETELPSYGGQYGEHPLPGTWYFDGRAHQLVYVVNTGSRLSLDGKDGEKQVRFNARLLRGHIQFAGSTVETVVGVTLLPDKPYRWQ